MSMSENLKLRVLLSWAVDYVERETKCLEESCRGRDGAIEDEIGESVATDVADARRWLAEAREVLG